MYNHLSTVCESLMTEEGGAEEDKLKNFVKKEVDKNLKPNNYMLLKIDESSVEPVGKKT